MGNFWRDIKYGAHMLTAKPGFTAIAVLTLALGIGANTAIFSVIYGMIFRPLPGATNPGELVSLILTDGENSWPHNLSYSSYKDYRELKEVFTDATASLSTFVQFSTEGSSPERIFPSIVTGNYFDVLGVKMFHGRAFAPEEAERMGAGNVLILGYDYWQRRFGGDVSAVGTLAKVNGHPFTIIGIAPKEFRGTSAYFSSVGYIPVTGVDHIFPEWSKTIEDRSRGGGFQVIARLQPGVGIREARAAAETHATRLAQEYPETQSNQRALVHPEPLVRMEPSAIVFMPRIAAVFMTLVGLVLLIACANVANLLLARATSRQKEMVIRSALGAGRWQIIRQLLTESVLLALMGGGLGLIFGRWGTDAIGSINPATDLPLDFNFSMDYRIFGFTLAIALLTGIIAGLVPAWQASRTDLAVTLKEGGRSAHASSRHWLRSALVVSQVAVSLILLISAGLFVRTARNTVDIDMGFELENRLVVAMDPEIRQYDEPRGRIFYRELLDRVRTMPGVISASTGRFLPIGFGNGIQEVYVEGTVPEKDAAAPFAFYNVVNTDYFKTMGMPIVQGRTFTEDDNEDNRSVVIINDKMAEEFWPGENPLGKRFRTGVLEEPMLEVVGVTRTVKFSLPSESPISGFYFPFQQKYRSDAVLHVHTQGDPLLLVSPVRAEIQTLDSEMPIWDVRTMEKHIREGKMVLFDLATGTVGSFGLIGLVMAAIGLYGVMAYAVSQRTHEIGVRMALGASSGEILGMVVRQGMTLVGIGLFLGIIGALGITPSFANLLVGVTPRDPLTYVVIAVTLTGVALVACLVPARRATQVDPMVALRYE